MSSTEVISADDLARSLFDLILVPLAEARHASGRGNYFARAPEAGGTSYFAVCERAAAQPADFDFPGGGDAAGLIDALEAYWIQQGEDGLAAMAPRLKEIAAALRGEAKESDGTVDVLCYTMF
jgi:hypothetical protein